MNTLFSDPKLEPRRKTYLKAVLCLLPALIFWEAVSVKCVPIFVNIVQNSGPQKETFEQFWNISMFLVRHGFLILAAVVVVFFLLELFSQSWARYRQSAVGAAVWWLNLTVLFGLTSFFTLALVSFPRLVK